MGIGFGAGLTAHLHRQPEQPLVALRRLAQSRVSKRFRDIINDSVIEFYFDAQDMLQERWLPAEEAAPVISAADAFRGFAPSRMLHHFDQFDALLPNMYQSRRLTLRESPFDGWDLAPFDPAIQTAQASYELIELEPQLELVDHIARGIAAARAHDLPWSFAW